MNKQELETKYAKLLEKTGAFTLRSIETMNHRPHKFMIGPKHIKHAQDHCNGKLGDRTLNFIPCADPRCRMPYKDHTYDTVMMISLTRDLLKTDAEEILESIKLNGMDEDGIDGFLFIDTEEKFRFV